MNKLPKEERAWRTVSDAIIAYGKTWNRKIETVGTPVLTDAAPGHSARVCVGVCVKPKRRKP